MMRPLQLIMHTLSVLALAALLLAVLVAAAGAHDRGFKPEQNAWLERQYSRDGMKCCDQHDVHIGVEVQWRFQGGHYEVVMDGRWVRVPDGRLLMPRPGDPSPWGMAPLLFYTPGQALPWCFMPEPLL